MPCSGKDHKIARKRQGRGQGRRAATISGEKKRDWGGGNRNDEKGVLGTEKTLFQKKCARIGIARFAKHL